MDILILDSWLREYIETDATPKKVAEYLSLCGPSVNKIEPVGRGNKKDYVYHIEVTTNRADSASVYGIAREAWAILPRFGRKVRFNQLKSNLKQNSVSEVNYLEAKIDHKLCPRFTAVLIKDVQVKPSSEKIKERLSLVGVRPINNVIDISNYLMYELGQPMHTFDYDKIKGSKMVLRASKKGEKLTTLDGKIHTLLGGDIIIEDGKGRLIDLAGIVGGENSQVDAKTKNVLLFVQTYNPLNIRRTSISLALRSEAAVLFEKGLDPELVSLGIKRGIELFEKLTDGKAEPEILDLYPKPYKPKRLKTDIEFITSRLGIEIEKKEISRLLEALGFKTSWSGKDIEIIVPSFRTNDISISEDIVEEVARIYGYHNFPSYLMQGSLPEPPKNTPFEFEIKVKRILKGMGATEVYNYSMVPKEFVEKNALRLKNPLGAESEYMRDSLRPSLIQSVKQNSGEKGPFHLFEMANVYLPRKGKLPDEKVTLAGIFSNYTYREAKGVIESLLEQLNINAEYKPEDSQHFLPSRRVKIATGNTPLGELGIVSTRGGSAFGGDEKRLIYYEFDVEKLRKSSKSVSSYRPIPKYPAQIEDITLTLPERTRVGNIVSSILTASKLVKSVELTDIFKDAYTFRVWYQHPGKTLTDKEVEEIRNKLLKEVKKKFGATQKI